MLVKIRDYIRAMGASFKFGGKAKKIFFRFLVAIGVRRLFHIYADMTERRNPTETQKEFTRVIEGLSSQVDEVENMLADDKSKKVYRNIIEYRKTKNRKCLKGIITKNQYFQKEIFNNISEHERFVDGGCYDGHEIIGFAKFVGGRYDAVYAFEPLKDMGDVIKANVKKHGLENVTIYSVGLWKEKTTLSFAACETASQASTHDTGEEIVEVDSLDGLFPEESITWIKMDIEGSEMDALRGAAELIKRTKPKLSICLYHKPEDLVEIPMYIKSLVPEYKLYVRHHTDVRYETVLYATVE